MNKLSFYVIFENNGNFEPYDIIPYFEHEYIKRVSDNHPYYKVPKTFDEFKKFIDDSAKYQYWARCQYEIILSDWPCERVSEKWDIYKQISMNIDIITKLFMEHINKN